MTPEGPMFAGSFIETARGRPGDLNRRFRLSLFKQLDAKAQHLERQVIQRP